MEGDTQTQLDRRADRTLLLGLALLPGFLLAMGVVAWALDEDVGTAILGIHVVAQFIVLVAYATMLSTDRALGALGRGIWALAFLFAAPAALPLYWWVRLREPDRETRGGVIEIPIRSDWSPRPAR